LRKRTFWICPRSRNGRLNLGLLRVAALERRFDWGQRRWYKHSPYPDDGSPLWHISWNVLSRPDRRGKLFTVDPSGFYQSPAKFQINRQNQKDQHTE
jgi:hypothetical protein